MPSATEFLDLARTIRQLAQRAKRLSDEHALDGDATSLARYAQELDNQATSFEKLAAMASPAAMLSVDALSEHSPRLPADRTNPILHLKPRR